MLQLIFIVTLSVFSFPSHGEAQSDNEDRFDCGQEQFVACLSEMRARAPTSEECRQMAQYEHKNRFHWEGRKYYEHEEWIIRKELEVLGLKPSYAMAPIDYVRYVHKDNEIVALFQPSNFGKHQDIGRRYSLVVFGGKLSLNTCSDPGIYPWNQMVLYGRKVDEKAWQKLGEFEADASVHRAGQKFNKVSKWFHKTVPISCPKSNRHLKDEITVCFTNLTNKEWPEVHVWNDHLASTGIQMDSYRWKDGKWLSWVKESESLFEVHNGEVLLVHGLHARERKWEKAPPGVELWDSSTGKFKESEKWVRKLLKPFKVTTIGESPETKDPGFYCFGRTAPFNGYYDDCVELIKKGSNVPDVFVAEPLEAKVIFIVGTSFRHLSLKEKESMIAELPKYFSTIAWQLDSHKFEEHPMNRYDRLLIEYNEPINVKLGGETRSIEKTTIPVPDSQFLDKSYKDKWGLDVGAFYIHGKEHTWVGRMKEGRNFFCAKSFDLLKHQAAIKVLCAN